MKKTMITISLIIVFLGLGVFRSSHKDIAATFSHGDSMKWLRLFPEYPNVSVQELAQDISLNGNYGQMAYFTTTEPIDKLANFYFSVWQAWGFAPEQLHHQQGSTISVLDKKRAQLLSASVIDNYRDRVVFLSRMPFVAEKTLQAPIEIPAPERAFSLYRNAMNSSGLGSSHTLWGVPLSAMHVISFYEKELSNLGFSLKKRSQHEQLEVMLYQAGKVIIQLGIKELKATPPSTVIDVVYMEQP